MWCGWDSFLVLSTPKTVPAPCLASRQDRDDDATPTSGCRGNVHGRNVAATSDFGEEIRDTWFSRRIVKEVRSITHLRNCISVGSCSTSDSMTYRDDVRERVVLRDVTR